MFVGIDVATERKGFHVAVVDDASVVRLYRCFSPREVVESIGDASVIAIDAPRRATILGPETRLAERELHRAGYRIQWTRRQPAEPQAWMLNGEALWSALLDAFPTASIIETFPTAAWRNLERSTLTVDLSTFADSDRATRGDFLDAIVAADVAARWHCGDAIEFGSGDELASIWT